MVHGIGGIAEKMFRGYLPETRRERDLQEHQIQGCMFSCMLPPFPYSNAVSYNRKWGVVADYASKKKFQPPILGFPPHLHFGNEHFQVLTASNRSLVTPRLALKRLPTLNPCLFQANSCADDFWLATLSYNAGLSQCRIGGAPTWLNQEALKE